LEQGTLNWIVRVDRAREIVVTPLILVAPISDKQGPPSTPFLDQTTALCNRFKCVDHRSLGIQLRHISFVPNIAQRSIPIVSSCDKTASLEAVGREETMKRTFSMLFGLLFVTAVAMAPASAHNTGPKFNAAIGAGHFLVADSLDVEFAFFAIEHKDGRVTGAFHHRTNDGLGLVDFEARVTCLAVDSELGRAWVGGVIIKNSSTSPDYTQPNQQPGHDIWFRVLEGDEDANQGSRSTFIGFEGAIPSSAEYCATRPWPDNNARTWPVTQGHIVVR
jgi:hypothetical protein